MSEFWEYIEGTQLVKSLRQLRKEMLREAMIRFYELQEEDDLPYDADDIEDVLDTIVFSCLVAGNGSLDWTSVYSTLYDDLYDENISVATACLPDFKFGGITKTYEKKSGDTSHSYTLWRYSPRGEASAMVRYADCLYSLKASITVWLQGYYEMNPIRCVEGDYFYLKDNPLEWVHFIDYASKTILRVVYGLIMGNGCCLKSLSPYTRYAFIYTLSNLKDTLDIDIYYSDEYLKSDNLVDNFNKMFDGVEFSYTVKDNFTKKILNLSEDDWRLSNYFKRLCSDFFLIVRKGKQVPVVFEAQRMRRGLYKKL